MKRTLAIIGTAGRGQDASLLTTSHFTNMMEWAFKVIRDEETTELVSGGSAWADFVAVRVHEMYPWNKIHLFLPKQLRDRLRLQNLHCDFGEVTGITKSWERTFRLPRTSVGSFKDRNTCVANAADVFLAMTFGNGPVVKDGGTADTVAKMLARGVEGYHLDLWTGTLHKGARLS